VDGGCKSRGAEEKRPESTGASKRRGEKYSDAHERTGWNNYDSFSSRPRHRLLAAHTHARTLTNSVASARTLRSSPPSFPPYTLPNHPLQHTHTHCRTPFPTPLCPMSTPARFTPTTAPPISSPFLSRRRVPSPVPPCHVPFHTMVYKLSRNMRACFNYYKSGSGESTTPPPLLPGRARAVLILFLPLPPPPSVPPP
jgi:hypothetical protein